MASLPARHHRPVDDPSLQKRPEQIRRPSSLHVHATKLEEFTFLRRRMNRLMGWRLSWENLNRKPEIFPWNMGVSCNVSLKPINWKPSDRWMRTGWWFTNPSETYEDSSIGMMTFPTEWKNKVHVPVTTNQPNFGFDFIMMKPISPAHFPGVYIHM